MAPPQDQSASDDPIIAEYDVYITSDPADEIYLLQYPNRRRDQPYNEGHDAKPYELRIKPHSGFLEVDVPIQHRSNFDQIKALQWGEALKRAKEEGQHTFGVASGFERMPVPRGVRQGQIGQTDEEADDGDYEKMLENFDDAIDSGLVMNKQTLGGQIIRHTSGKPMYMLGAFRGTELHLTTLRGVVQMRPQFHHLDAATYLEQSNRRREANEASRVTEARAVHMNIKAPDGENVDLNNTKPFLIFAKEEDWATLKHSDEESAEAYQVYHDRLFVQDTGAAQRLSSSMSNEQYLEAISAPRHDPSGHAKTKPLTKRQMKAIDLSDDEDVNENDNVPGNVDVPQEVSET